MNNYKEKRVEILAGILLVLSIGLASFSVQEISAQESKTEIFLETLSLAEAKTKAKEWDEAALLWEKVVKLNPVEGKFRNRLATAFYNAKKYRKAIPAYEKAIELRYGNPANNAYNIASCYALMDEKEQACNGLKKRCRWAFLI